jgi:hypothetical protein
MCNRLQQQQQQQQQEQQQSMSASLQRKHGSRTQSDCGAHSNTSASAAHVVQDSAMPHVAVQR